MSTKTKKLTYFTAILALLNKEGTQLPGLVVETYKTLAREVWNVGDGDYVEGKQRLNKKAFELALTPGSAFYGELESGSKDEAAAYACGLRTVIAGLIFGDEVGVNTKTSQKVNKLIDYISKLNNPFIKKYFLVDGRGWKLAIGGSTPMTLPVLATLVSPFTDDNIIANGDGLFWLVPNFDALLADEAEEKAFQQIVGNYALRLEENTKAVEEAFDKAEENINAALEKSIKECEATCSSFEENMKKEAKLFKKLLKGKAPKSEKKAANKSVEFTTGEKIAIGVGAAAVIAGAAYGAYKLWDVISDSGATTVTSHNDFSNFC